MIGHSAAVDGNGQSHASSVDAELFERLTEHPEATTADVVEWIHALDPLADSISVARMAQRLTGRARGLGRIEELLGDHTISEIMINGPGPVWLDRGYRLQPGELELDHHDIALFIERVLDPLGLRVDRSSPMADARLPDGSRVNIVLPPLALDGPVITIRRFGARPVPLESFGSDVVLSMLQELVDERATMLVVGGTAAGKTTLLNAIGSLIGHDERLVTIEDTAELRFSHPHVVRLEARPANSEGVGGVSLRDLVRNALRMRPDRLVIGEVRGAEALDLVLALNTGHRGSLATCHAGDPDGALRRLETLALLGDVDLPVEAIRRQIHDALDVVLVVERVGDERRIVEVARLDEQMEATGRPRTVWQQAKGSAA